jgi:hypothetical protein
MILTVNNHYFSLQHLPVCLSNKGSVLCEVRIKNLYIMQANFSFKHD